MEQSGGTCSACGHPYGAGSKFCSQCGAPLDSSAPAAVPLASSSSLSAARPPQPDSEGRLEEERRLVTALFCDLVGFTTLAERLDPEEVREIQAAYFGAMSTQIERYGGTVEKYAGDAVLALFGVPLAHEDDPERAVLCALDMQQVIQPVAAEVRSRYNVEVAIRVGVNTGEVVSGSWELTQGVAGPQQAAVTGDATNTAARLQTAAGPGGVLVGPETMRLTRRRIQYGERQELDLKGKLDPIAAYEALRVRDQIDERWEEGGGYATPLVGRERELDVLRSAWEGTVGGGGRVVTVIGEPGVGKSRLLAEALDRTAKVHSARVVPARCLSYGQSISLWLIADLVRAICAVSRDARPEVVRQTVDASIEVVLADCDEADRSIARDVMGEVLGLPPGASLVAQADPRVRRSALIRTLRLVLSGLAARGPLVLVLEDLHWVDAASQAILEAVLLDVPDGPILALITQRPGWSAPWDDAHSERLVVRPLEEREAAVLATAVLRGARLTAELEAHLRQRAEGNPFFVEELLRYLDETGGLEEEGGAVGLRPGVAEKLPTTLMEVLLGRLDRLERQVKGVAQIGSVIGRSFAVPLLASVMERETELLDEPLRALQEAEVTYPRGDVELEHVFRHALLRDAAYAMLVRRRRKELHLRVGRAIAHLYPTDEYVEIIAYHLARTDEDREAAAWLERAGDRAHRTFDNDAAIGHYRDALERMERSGAGLLELAAVEGKLGTSLNRAARFPEAESVLRHAIARYEDAGRPERAGKAVADLSHALNQQGRTEEARQRAEAMVELLASEGPSPTAVRLQLLLADVAQNTGRYSEMLAAAQRMGELAAAVGDEGELGRSHERRGAALIFLGSVEEAQAALELGIYHMERAGALTGLGPAFANLAEVRRLAGDLHGAIELTQRGLEMNVRTGNARAVPFHHLNLAQLQLVAGEWSAADEHLARAEELAPTAGNRAIANAILPHAKGELALRRGDREEARRLLEAAMERARGTFQQVVELAQIDLAELDILEGHPDLACDRLLALPEASRGPNGTALLAWARLDLEGPQQALELAESAERQIQERQSLSDLPETLRVKGMALARLGACHEARAILGEAREQAQKMSTPYTEARSLAELGLLDRQEGLADSARQRLQAALAIFRRLGAKMDVARLESELEALDQVPR